MKLKYEVKSETDSTDIASEMCMEALALDEMVKEERMGKKKGVACVKKESWEWQGIFIERPCELWSGTGDENRSEISHLWELLFLRKE